MIRKISLIKLLQILLKKRKVCIFFLRGGLGNQLFQLLNMIQIANREDFIVVFSESDVRKNPRDRNGAMAFKLHFDIALNHSNIAFRTNSIINIVLRIIKSEKNKLIFLKNINFDSNTWVIDKYLFTGNGYLQNQIDTLLTQAISLPLNLIRYDILDKKAEVALHIRATDSVSHSDMSIEDSYYEKALVTLGIERNSKIDVYSDDLHYAKKLCAQLGLYQFNFVEENQSFSAIELLASLSGYNSIISSKSTLCWWACNFATIKNKNVRIISPWDALYHQETWIR